MGGAHHERGRENPAGNELLQHQRAERLTGLPVLVAGHVNQVAVPSPELEIGAQAGLGDDLFDAAAQFGADLVQPLGGPLLLAGVDDGQHGRQRPRLRSGGLGQQEHPVGIVGEAAEAHHLPRPASADTGNPFAMPLPNVHRSGSMP